MSDSNNKKFVKWNIIVYIYCIVWERIKKAEEIVVTSDNIAIFMLAFTNTIK